LPKTAKPGLVIVDHIQAATRGLKMDAGSQAGALTRVMKAVAEDCNAAVLLLSQRNNAGNTRPNPRPRAADLHGGEGAKQDFDVLFSLYRPIAWCGDEMPPDSPAGARTAWFQAYGKRGRGVPEMPDDAYAELGAIKVRQGIKGEWRELEFIGERTLFRSPYQSQIHQERMAV
jgi:replicative DNA helicase